VAEQVDSLTDTGRRGSYEHRGALWGRRFDAGGKAGVSSPRWFAQCIQSLDTALGLQCEALGLDLTSSGSLRGGSELVGEVFAELDNASIRTADRAAVQVYLWKHPRMCGIVMEAVRESRSEFGDVVSLLLEVRTDPETSDEYLRLCIRANEYDGEFVNRLRSLRNRCPAFDGSGGALLLTSDFA